MRHPYFAAFQSTIGFDELADTIDELSVRDSHAVLFSQAICAGRSSEIAVASLTMSITASDTIAILLAAGRSRRFGSQDKIYAQLGGKPLIAHVAAALAALPFAQRLVVMAPQTPIPAGFDAIANNQPERGLGYSLASGVGAASVRRPAAILVALADMPFVPTSHFAALLGKFDQSIGKIATASPAGKAMVPAMFGASFFDLLAELDGDRGAQMLLADAPRVAADPMCLIDIDRPADLAAAAARPG